MGSTRNPVFRNVLGSMLGGSFGILTTAYASVWLMGIAVLFGVSVGWCHDYIWRKAKFLASPAQLAEVLQSAAGICVCCLNVCLALLVLQNFYPADTESSEIGDYYILCGLVCIMVAVMPALMCFERFKPGETRPFQAFRDSEKKRDRLEHRGSVLFFLGECIACFLMANASMAMLLLMAVYMTPLAFALLFLVFAPIGFTLVPLSLLCRMALRRGATLCLAVTLMTTTLTSCLLLTAEMSHTSVFAIALLTGGASAVLTEALRRCFVSARSLKKLMLQIARIDGFAVGDRVMNWIWVKLLAPWSPIFGRNPAMEVRVS